jgi:MYXO-CTERM domain-containing protein
MLSCGGCGADQSCVGNTCVANPPDLATSVDMAQGTDGGGGGGGGGSGGGGCGCHVAARSGTTPPWTVFAIAFVLGARLRRRARAVG